MKFPFNNTAENKILKQQNIIMKGLVIQQQITTLPRCEMFVFNGDLTQYQTFCQSFKALIASYIIWNNLHLDDLRS